MLLLSEASCAVLDQVAEGLFPRIDGERSVALSFLEAGLDPEKTVNCNWRASGRQPALSCWKRGGTAGQYARASNQKLRRYLLLFLRDRNHPIALDGYRLGLGQNIPAGREQFTARVPTGLGCAEI